MLKILKNKIPLSLKPSGPYALWRVGSIILVGVLLGAAIFVSTFIYTHIFNTLANANAIVILNSNLNITSIDLAAYAQNQTAIQNKKQVLTIPANLRNIFLYASSTPYATSTKPKR